MANALLRCQHAPAWFQGHGFPGLADFAFTLQVKRQDQNLVQPSPAPFQGSPQRHLTPLVPEQALFPNCLGVGIRSCWLAAASVLHLQASLTSKTSWACCEASWVTALAVSAYKCMPKELLQGEWFHASAAGNHGRFHDSACKKLCIFQERLCLLNVPLGRCEARGADTGIIEQRCSN